MAGKKDEPRDHYADRVNSVRAKLGDDAVNDHAAMVELVELVADMLGVGPAPQLMPAAEQATEPEEAPQAP